MRVSLILRAVNKEGLSNLKKIMDNALAEAPQYLLKVKKDQQQIVFDKIKHLNRWYTKIIGLDEVKVYQERVTALQDQLLKTQTKRRELNTHLTEIRQKALEIQSQIQHIDRKEKFDAYCHLINDERTILNMERTANATFKEYDQAERELFTAFTNAVRDSQEKQRSQLEYSKYITMVLSLVGSFIAFLFTFFWKHDLKLYIHNEVSSIKPSIPTDVLVQKEMKKFEDQLNVATNRIQSINETYFGQIAKQRNIPVADMGKVPDQTPIASYVVAGFVGYIILRLLVG
ncbi:unnamed protein product [Psylliodes chrysocephalus]|uniref:Coiled-coil domain-containing protein 51 n=1 Tax=Psylliodes chrysocephalus TaxID=3402493 RepID=A0A9P0D708_9CUCU|nr:unnamed protein product [Psylliodes chrysocephala]